ncbi:uncharacterized protein LOC125505355 [Dendroctonus ponderosae]|uniref:uncharacterized protein LOC125505355 n=1 Tax=Dendroctonus ponderosae TaxID=77166 RepID=UPI0020363289|nr:uncharacterized protein LOC125505355 [Dendroctonus ponderosae]
MHPSIIKLNDLSVELKTLEKLIAPKQLPIPTTFMNMFMYENVIDIDCFILSNKITYLLRVPITNPINFDYFHLYSVPIKHQSLFKVVIPRDKYLIKNQLHYTYQQEPCKKIQPNTFLCNKEELNEVGKDSPCEVQLLQSPKYTSACRQVDASIKDPIINQLDATNQWLLILPKENMLDLICPNQQEHKSLSGTYLVTIPTGCQMKSKDISIINSQTVTESNRQQPIIFPDFEEKQPIELLPTLNLSFHLQDVKLDELHKLRNKIENNHPNLFFNQITKAPSLWTIFIYVVLFLLLLYLLCSHIKARCTLKKTESTSPRIELPLQQV